MSTKIAYMLDTNVLCDWLESFIPHISAGNEYYIANPRQWKWHLNNIARIKQFMECNENVIYIPDLVWSEFLGVTLHKDMDVSKDIQQLKLCFRLLFGVIQQIEAVIHRKSPMIKIISAESEKFQSSPFSNGAELVTDLDLIDEAMFRVMKGNYPDRTREKFLDGMDAVIVSYLDNLAANHPDQRIMLYTGDKRLFNGFARIRSYWKNHGFAQNTGAIYSSAPSIKTKTGQYSARVLERADISEIELI